MVLFEPNRTPYDLQFRVFSVPVRIHPVFWLFSAMLGWGWMQFGFAFLLAWVGTVLVSILIHEFGHVFAFAAFGVRSQVVLYGFGGLAIPTHSPYKRHERILISLAGPVAGFVFIAAIMGILYSVNRDLFISSVGFAGSILNIPFIDDVWKGEGVREILFLQNVAVFAIFCLLFINILWGVLNLLPIWPLDGGHVTREVLDGIAPGHGVRWSLGISLVLAGVLCLHGLMSHFGEKPLIPYVPGGIFMALLFGLLAIQSFMEMQKVSRDRRWLDEHWRGD